MRLFLQDLRRISLFGNEDRIDFSNETQDQGFPWSMPRTRAVIQNNGWMKLGLDPRKPPHIVPRDYPPKDRVVGYTP
jgi:hypothetical protein